MTTQSLPVAAFFLVEERRLTTLLDCFFKRFPPLVRDWADLLWVALALRLLVFLEAVRRAGGTVFLSEPARNSAALMV